MVGEINAQELARALSALAKQSSSMSDNIRTASEVIADYTDPVVKSQKDYETYVKKMKGLQSQELKDKQELISQLKLNQGLTQREADSRKKEIDQLQADIESKTKLRTKQMRIAADMEKRYGMLDDATTTAKTAVTSLSTELDAANATLKSARNAEQKHTTELGKFTSAISTQEKEFKKLSFAEAGKTISNGIISSTKDSLKQIIGKTSFVDIAKDFFATTRREISTGVNAASSGKEYTQLANLGMSAGKFTDLLQQNRTGVLAAGGKDATLQFMTQIDKTYKSLIPFGDRAEFAAQQMSLLTSAGVKPTIETSKLLFNSFVKLQKTAGLTGDQFSTSMADIVNSQEVQQTLLGTASQTERAAIVANIAARFAENKAIGFTTEQSIRLAKIQSKLANDNPLDRLKRGAKQAALASALGVDGGDRARQIELKSDKNRTPEDKAFLQKFYDQVSQKVSSGLQSDNFGQQVFTQGLQSKLGTDETGANSPFNSSLARVAQANEDSIKSLGDVSASTNNLINSIDKLTSQLTNNPIMQGAVAGVSNITGLLGSAASGLGGGALASMLTKGGAAAEGGSLLSGAAAIGKGFIKRAPLIGALAQGGMAAYDYANGDKKGAASNAGGAAGSLIGGAIGTLLLPGVGTVIGAGLGSVAGQYLGGKYAGDNSQSTALATPMNESNDMLSKQVKQLDDSNMYLKQLADTMPRLVDLSEKQLIAMTLTEKSRTSEAVRSKLIGGSRFAGQYLSV